MRFSTFVLASVFLTSRAWAAGPAASPPITPRAFFPAPESKNLPPDAPLRITFARPPVLGTGKITLVEGAVKGVPLASTPLASIDVSAKTATRTIGGIPGFHYRPLLVTGNDLLITFDQPRAYNKTYTVIVEKSAIKDSVAADAPNDAPFVWTFSTRAAAPDATVSTLNVSPDGSADFCTLQGALDFIPAGNTKPVIILLKPGTYREIVCLNGGGGGKHNITIKGEDRKKTILEYPNNAVLNGDGGNPYANNASDPSANDPLKPGGGEPMYRRAVFTAHRVDDLTLANFTIRNTTPKGGSQAETIILNGTPTARAILKDLDLYSFQDTLQINGQAYLSNCYIEGDVDFMWGTGPVFFDTCTCRSVNSRAYYTQIRNPASHHGFVYFRSTFDGAPGVSGMFLSRIEPRRFPGSEVALINCILTDAVSPVAWQLQTPRPAPGTTAPALDLSQLRFLEFRSHYANNEPVDVSQRMPGSRQLARPEDDAAIDNYSNPAWVLGHDWNPKSAPIFK